jgi:hypothetical protein
MSSIILGLGMGRIRFGFGNKEYPMKKSLIFLTLILAMGCETTRPVVKYPGFSMKAGEATCVLRESDHCFIGSIDNQPIEQYDVNILSPATYRQYRIPAGKHELAVFFRENRNFDLISSGPRHVDIDVHDDRSYELKANVNSMDVAFGNVLSTVSWRPAVTDSQSGACVGQATLSVQ